MPKIIVDSDSSEDADFYRFPSLECYAEEELNQNIEKNEEINCWKLKNFQPLRGLPLTSLTANRLTQREMTLLKGMPLTRLSIDGCKITSLDALAGMRLTRLSVGGCRTLDNLRGIEKMPLEYLNLSGTRFATKQVAENLKKKIPTLKEVKIK